jgi:hypothetical protein
MRIFAATLALTATVLCGLLAGGYLLSARYTGSAAAIRAKTRTDQLRAASAELLDPDALAARRAAALQRRLRGKATADGASLASRHRTLGLALAVGAALGLLAVVLLFVNRLRRIALFGVAVGALAGILGLVLEGFVVLFAVITGLQAAALLLGWRAKRRAPPAPTQPARQAEPLIEPESAEVTP